MLKEKTFEPLRIICAIGAHPDDCDSNLGEQLPYMPS